MLNIILGDDDSYLLELEKEKLLEEIAYSEIDAQIVCMARSGAELLTYLKRQQEHFLCFLDLDFGRDGITSFKKWRGAFWIYRKNARYDISSDWISQVSSDGSTCISDKRWLRRKY